MALDRLAQGARVYLDPNIVIHTVEEPRPISLGQRKLIASIDSGTLVGVTSELTVAECLVHPFETGDRKRLQRAFVPICGPRFLTQSMPPRLSLLALPLS